MNWENLRRSSQESVFIQILQKGIKYIIVGEVTGHMILAETSLSMKKFKNMNQYWWEKFDYWIEYWLVKI